MSAADDRFDLERFVIAQAGTFDAALAELRAGRKRTHWSWFVLPQLRGLGRSERALRYGLAGEDEARAYLAHPVLGPRLHACFEALTAHAGRTAASMLGEVDAMKLHACATLFARVAQAGSPFRVALDTFFDGREDAATLARLA